MSLKFWRKAWNAAIDLRITAKMDGAEFTPDG